MSRPRPQVESLDLGRTLWNQGLLREAELALSAIEPESSAADRASALLILGNIAYERGDYAKAVDEWVTASELYGLDGTMEAGVEVAAANLAMAKARIARSAELTTQARQLSVGLAAVLVLAAAALAIGYWKSKGPSGFAINNSAGDQGRPS